MIRQFKIRPNIFSMPVHEALMNLLSYVDNSFYEEKETEEQKNDLEETYKDVRTIKDNDGTHVTANFVIKFTSFTSKLHGDVLNFLESNIDDFNNKALWDNAKVTITFEYLPNHKTSTVTINNRKDILKKLVFLKNKKYFNNTFEITPTVKISKDINKNTNLKKNWKDYLKNFNTNKIKNEELSNLESENKDTIFINALFNLVTKYGYTLDKDIIIQALKKN